eukprot:m.88034 g.88034  ORF g.88034 m.88034 type:complete len:53 (+) comp8799_c0_seq9:166-324(+)
MQTFKNKKNRVETRTLLLPDERKYFGSLFKGASMLVIAQEAALLCSGDSCGW